MLFGKTNMDEFAMGSSTENSAYQLTRNPWDTARIPGGSSGGSAAAVAGCQAPLSLGTDTGGSIRQPAALCGIVGMKPTYGRVSRYGLIAFASSLDQIGPFAHDVADAALLLEVIAGHDRRDSTSVDRPVPRIPTNAQPAGEGAADRRAAGVLRQGSRRRDRSGRARSRSRNTRSSGATLVDVSLPHSKYALAAYYIVAPAEASSNLARFDGMHYGHRTKTKADLIAHVLPSRAAKGFGKEVQRRIMIGTYVLSSGYKDAYYLKALKVRRLVKKDYDDAFAKCDVIVGPTTPTAGIQGGREVGRPAGDVPFRRLHRGRQPRGHPGPEHPVRLHEDRLAHRPATARAPIRGGETAPRRRMYESVTDWHTRRPKV